VSSPQERDLIDPTERFGRYRTEIVKGEWSLRHQVDGEVDEADAAILQRAEVPFLCCYAV